MKSAVLLLNFGEPERPLPEEVLPFLERIFSMNDHLEGRNGESARERASRLAEMRAPGLIAEYESIGGSPLRRQANEQASLLEAELAGRGHDVVCITGMQFTAPFIIDAVKRARGAGADQIIALPVYPLCGPSTTVAALTRLEHDLRQQLWSVPVHQISGWHSHPAYIAFRANAVRQTMAANGLSFDDPRTRLVFSAHGTPMKYINEGSRYDVYVRDYCQSLAHALGVTDYVIGYQNHTSRAIEWTQPDIEHVIEEIDADRVIVDAVSFMHEQSETLAELDQELRADAEQRGLEFFRVPIEHDAATFIRFLADLAEPFLAPAVVDAAVWNGGPHTTSVNGRETAWESCRCKAGAYCLHGVSCA